MGCVLVEPYSCISLTQTRHKPHLPTPIATPIKEDPVMPVYVLLGPVLNQSAQFGIKKMVITSFYAKPCT